MATLALSRPIPPHRPASSLDNPITPPLSFDQSSATPQFTPPVPNKHIPVCPPGPALDDQLETPPESPQSIDERTQTSVLYPPDAFHRLDSGPLSVYEIDADHVASALEIASRQPLPDPNLVFPWCHGLHPHNHLQQAFFNARKRASGKTPTCMRTITVVKADGDLGVARLKGAVAPDELIHTDPTPEFVEADPREGFSVRNFHIQTAKQALVSDIIVYGDDAAAARRVAWDMAAAQQRWRERHDNLHDLPHYNTFVCISPFQEFEDMYGDIVSVDSQGCSTGAILDFVQQERREMWNMTQATEIAYNVYMGPTPELGSLEEREFDILIECSDSGRLNPGALQLVAESFSDTVTQPYHDFPSSGSIPPPTWSHKEADGIIDTCRWIYHLAHGTRPATKSQTTDMDGDSFMGQQSAFDDDDDDEDDINADEEKGCAPNFTPRKILIHCGDGYTESTLLGIAYFSYSSGRPVPDAWLHLHTTMGRNFFAYPSDVGLLTALAPRLLHESPACTGKSLLDITNLIKHEPSWLAGLDGSFPSRILDYLYLGNLGHANNPDLLRELGIHQILSVGETAIWRDGDMEAWGEDNVCTVHGVQDNGIDPLTDEFTRCLEFIGKKSSLMTTRIAYMRCKAVN
jgi:dual specificity MAP kinase phosphatase